MKIAKYNIKPVAGLLALIMASSLTFNASASVSEKCKSGLVPMQKALTSHGATNASIRTMLKYAGTQCTSVITGAQGKTGYYETRSRRGTGGNDEG